MSAEASAENPKNTPETQQDCVAARHSNRQREYSLLCRSATQGTRASLSLDFLRPRVPAPSFLLILNLLQLAFQFLYFCLRFLEKLLVLLGLQHGVVPQTFFFQPPFFFSSFKNTFYYCSRNPVRILHSNKLVSFLVGRSERHRMRKSIILVGCGLLMAAEATVMPSALPSLAPL